MPNNVITETTCNLQPGACDCAGNIADCLGQCLPSNDQDYAVADQCGNCPGVCDGTGSCDDEDVCGRCLSLGIPEPVTCNQNDLFSRGYKVYLASLQGKKVTPTLRHDPSSLALAIMRFYRRYKKDK